MDTVQKVFLNSAVCLYAVFGFSLSVLTSLLGLFGIGQIFKPQVQNVPRSKPRLLPLVPRNRPITRTLRSCSDKSSTAPLFSTPLEYKQHKRKVLASHRRSRSIPLITLDYFGSTEQLDMKPRSSFGTLPARKPLTFVIPQPPDRRRVESSHLADSDTQKSGSRLANLFSKEKKREKENLWKVRKPPSSPVVPQPLEDSTKQPQAPLKRRKSDIDERPLLSNEGQKKVRAPMRRVCSAPMEERLAMRFDLTFSRTVEKKKSTTLRTQPYEAPFFCPPPGQPRHPESQNTLDLTSKSSNKLKPSRSFTTKT